MLSQVRTVVGQLVESMLSVAGIRVGTEEPSYTARPLIDGVEIRRYGPRIAAETTVAAAEEAARSAGFRRLAGYIFGGAGFFALVRMSDRAEALVFVFVLAAALVIAPVAGVMGTAVHDARAQLYAEESQSRHPFTAAVIEDTTTTIEQTDVVVTALLQPGRGRR